MKSDELAHPGHIDSVAIRITDLRRRRNNHNAFGLLATKNLDDALAQSRSPHDAVVNDHNGIHSLPDSTVSRIVNMSGKIVSAVSLRDKRPQLDILYGQFLRPNLPTQDFPNLFARQTVLSLANQLAFPFIQPFLQSLHHPVIGNFRRIGYEREYGMLHIIVHALQNGIRQQTPQFLALPINVAIASPGKINPFKRTGRSLLHRMNLAQCHFAVSLHDNALPGQKLFHVFHAKVEHRLNHRTFGSHHHYFLAGIIKSGANPVRVTKSKHITAPRQPRDHISAIPQCRCLPQNTLYVNVVLNGIIDCLTVQTFLLEFPVQTFHFVIQQITELLENNESIGIVPRMLSPLHNIVHNLVHVGQVEIACQRQVPAPPVIATQKRMQIRHAGTTGRAVSQMPHIHLSDKRPLLFHCLWLPASEIIDSTMHRRKNILYCSRSFRPFPENILLARSGIQLDRRHSCPLLSAIVLLLHQQIELTQSPKGIPVFLPVIIQRLQQPHHGNPTLMLYCVTHKRFSKCTFRQK